MLVCRQRVYGDAVTCAGCKVHDFRNQKTLIDDYSPGKPISGGWYHLAIQKQIEVAQKIAELQTMEKVLGKLLHAVAG